MQVYDASMHTHTDFPDKSNIKKTYSNVPVCDQRMPGLTI